MITTDKAFERLIFTITKQNKPNQTDLEALKVIAEYVENSKKQEIRNNYLFAKMYVYNFTNEVTHLKDSFSNTFRIAQNNLHKALKLPLESSIKNCMNILNNNEYLLLCKRLNLNTPFVMVRNTEQIKHDEEIIKHNEEELLKYGFGIFEYDIFEEKIVNQITHAINQYKTLP